MPFEDDVDNYCYIYENESNIYFEYYGEEALISNNDATENGVPDAPLVQNAANHFYDSFKSNDESYWATYFGPATNIGCSAASYEVYKRKSKFSSLEGVYCVFFTISGEFEEYATGKPCSQCHNSSCDNFYRNLCNTNNNYV